MPIWRAERCPAIMLDIVPDRRRTQLFERRFPKFDLATRTG